MDHQHLLFCFQFTLLSVLKGNKLDFHNAMDGENSKTVYEDVLEKLRSAYEPSKIKGKRSLRFSILSIRIVFSISPCQL